MNRRMLSVLIVTSVSLMSANAHAEIFVLTHGGRVEGQWLNRDDAKPDTYEIEMLAGGRITLSASLVEDVIVQSEALRRYEELLPKVPHTVEGHLDMAERCRKAGLKTQREFHLQKVLELDPNQADARRGLGYSQVDGQWIRADEWFQNQGYVRHKGGWRLAQEVDLDSRHDRQVIEEKEWRKRLQVWRNSVVRGRNDAARGPGTTARRRQPAGYRRAVRNAGRPRRTESAQTAVHRCAQQVQSRDRLSPLCSNAS